MFGIDLGNPLTWDLRLLFVPVIILLFRIGFWVIKTSIGPLAKYHIPLWVVLYFVFYNICDKYTLPLDTFQRLMISGIPTLLWIIWDGMREFDGKKPVSMRGIPGLLVGILLPPVKRIMFRNKTRTADRNARKETEKSDTTEETVTDGGWIKTTIFDMEFEEKQKEFKKKQKEPEKNIVFDINDKDIIDAAYVEVEK